VTQGVRHLATANTQTTPPCGTSFCHPTICRCAAGRFPAPEVPKPAANLTGYSRKPELDILQLDGDCSSADIEERPCGRNLENGATPAAAGAKESGMIVKTILAAKGCEVVSIEPTADLVAAATLLTTRRIGVLVIVDAGGRLVGMLSERDIMRVLAESAGAALQLPVAQVMTRNVSTCGVNDTVSSILKRMTTGKFRHMPVLDNDLLVGLVSIGDIGKQQMEILHDHVRQLDEYIDHISLMKL
jgi:CBS domain-containing protein